MLAADGVAVILSAGCPEGREDGLALGSRLGIIDGSVLMVGGLLGLAVFCLEGLAVVG